MCKQGLIHVCFILDESGSMHGSESDVIGGFNKTIDDGVTTVTLKYTANNQKVIRGLKRISKPSLPVYTSAEELPKVLNGLGVAIISTSKGIMTDKEARKLKIGGEVLAYVW